MTSSEARFRRVSGRQLEILWEYLNTHRDIAVAYNRTLQAKEYSTRKWKEIAEMLNAQGDGAYKDWRGWSKYWVDYKAKLKKRTAALRASQTRTGGGPSTDHPLSEIENKFLRLLGEDFGQGLPGIRVEPFPELSESTAAVNVDSLPVLEIENQEPQILNPILATAQNSGATPTQHEPVPLPITPPVPPQHAAADTRTLASADAQSPAAADAEAPAAAGAASTPRRRRRRRGPLMSQESARCALIQSSQQRADAAVRSAQALERIGQGVADVQATLGRIERIMSAAFPRAAE